MSFLDKNQEKRTNRMNPSSVDMVKHRSLFVKVLMALLLSCNINRISLSSTPSTPLSFLKELKLEGEISFENLHHAAKDFGNRYHFLPAAILYPKSVSDISTVVKTVFQMGPTSGLTIAAKGRGHSVEGQAQASQGVVINMESLARYQGMQLYFDGEKAFVDVSAGELWINVLLKCLEYGLTPKSWTDYLRLTVGGTLSNAGISGQAFKFGPQINNVYRLEVVTGTGQVVTCSKELNSDLFNAVLGGLGQFGIITRAQISLEPAPKKVKWIRVLYLDFATFTKDQEQIISSNDTFDYVEGFVMINRTGLLNNWRSSFNPKDPVQASRFTSEGKTLFCLEVAKYFSLEDAETIDKKVDGLLSNLRYIESTLFISEVSYVEFLDRVYVSELKLREKGLWEVPHPWLNLLVPKSKIYDFAHEVFGKILPDNNGPILIYPVNKSRWNTQTSMVTPKEDVFYLVAFLSSAMPSSEGTESLEKILSQNKRILDVCERANLETKQYLPHYSTQEDWKAHFGDEWEVFVKRKLTYDPLALLAPGQRIFRKAITFL